jgi:hypothetical protein
MKNNKTVAYDFPAFSFVKQRDANAYKMHIGQIGDVPLFGANLLGDSIRAHSFAC